MRDRDRAEIEPAEPSGAHRARGAISAVRDRDRAEIEPAEPSGAHRARGAISAARDRDRAEIEPAAATWQVARRERMGWHERQPKWSELREQRIIGAGGFGTVRNHLPYMATTFLIWQRLIPLVRVACPRGAAELLSTWRR